MDTCQGQECGLAGSPFTMRDTTFGGTAGFPQGLGQSAKSKEKTVNYNVSGFLNIYVCLCLIKQHITAAES